MGIGRGRIDDHLLAGHLLCILINVLFSERTSCGIMEGRGGGGGGGRILTSSVSQLCPVYWKNP